MKKHIMEYFEVINESFGVGSVILINGKAEDSGKKLYATHIVGSAELNPGATMLFLSDDFYRIKKDGEKLKAVRIGFSNEAALKSALKVSSAGRISIIKNNNKTPFHWITLKHKVLHTALHAVEEVLNKDNYILE
jgi:hypothetical protein